MSGFLARLLIICLGSVSCAAASEPSAVPILVLEPGAHTARITSLATDAAQTRAATASIDGTVRLWDIDEPRLLRTFRLPRGAGSIGQAFSVALSPDGTLVAIGGWMRWREDDPQEQIYIFSADDGALQARLDGLPNVVLSLAFSPDGAHLVAGLGGASGARLWHKREGRWIAAEIAQQPAERTTAVAFLPDGRLLLSGAGGQIALYDTGGALLQQTTLDGKHPVGMAVSPEGTRVAISFAQGDRVAILDSQSLRQVDERSHDYPGAKGELAVVAWSANEIIAAGDRRISDDRALVVRWRDGSETDNIPVAGNTISGLSGLSNGDVLVASADPLLARISGDGERLWGIDAQKLDFRDQHDTIAVSEDGLLIDFAEESGGPSWRFDVNRLTLRKTDSDALTSLPFLPGDRLRNWNDSLQPTLDGQNLELAEAETARAAAATTSADRFIIGTDWHLRAYDEAGTLLWIRAMPSAVWALNVTANNHFAVAALGDGTIRWYRTGDGAEILALFVKPGGKDWVVWTPEGVYAARPGARSMLRWHVNRGWDATADAIPVHMVPNTSRPDVIRFVLPQQGYFGALAAAESAKIKEAIKRTTGATALPGARLHILSVGVGDYNADHADHLDLRYADNDAKDLTAALLRSQKGLYSDVRQMTLVDRDANKAGIMRALDTLHSALREGDGSDLALVYFSGHGAMVDEALYLLPHDVDARDPVQISATGIDVVAVQRKIAQISRHGRVLVLLDACRSGAATASGQQLDIDGDRLRSVMQGPNISVITSSSADEDSIERSEWENGAFTEALLEAINGHRADLNANGILTMTEITSYLKDRVPQMTEDISERAQNPSIEVRFQRDIFVVGL